jgi:hypothetical protein
LLILIELCEGGGASDPDIGSTTNEKGWDRYFGRKREDLEFRTRKGGAQLLAEETCMYNEQVFLTRVRRLADEQLSSIFLLPSIVYLRWIGRTKEDSSLLRLKRKL